MGQIWIETIQGCEFSPEINASILWGIGNRYALFIHISTWMSQVIL
jgi:hypothetical protein